MKRIVLLCSLLFLLVCGSALSAMDRMADHGGHGQHEGAASQPDIAKHRACPHCGMDREKFAHSRMLITYNDNTTVGVCSLHCATTELKANRSKPLKSVEVADLISKKLLEAGKAFWVIGGTKRGVMTRNPKWAFAGKTAADEFIRKQGGTSATYQEALTMAEKE